MTVSLPSLRGTREKLRLEGEGKVLRVEPNEKNRPGGIAVISDRFFLSEE
jgi:hypothetical protein